MSAQVWFEGHRVGARWPQLRALHYGDGVFRTLLAWNGAALDLEAQLAKLGDDARRLGLEFPTQVDWAAEIAAALGGDSTGVVKILLSRAETRRGYAPSSRDVLRLIAGYALPAYPADCWTQGVVVGAGAVKLARQPLLAGIKHLNRLEQVLASRDWPAGQHEALLADEQDLAIAGTRSNIFFVIDETLVTPRLAQCGVAGMMRDKILVLSAAAAQPAEQRDVPMAQLHRVQEAFLTNSLIGIWPVRQLLGRRLPSPGPVTRSLAGRLMHPYRGR